MLLRKYGNSLGVHFLPHTVGSEFQTANGSANLRITLGKLSMLKIIIQRILNVRCDIVHVVIFAIEKSFLGLWLGLGLTRLSADKLNWSNIIIIIFTCSVLSPGQTGRAADWTPHHGTVEPKCSFLAHLYLATSCTGTVSPFSSQNSSDNIAFIFFFNFLSQSFGVRFSVLED